jgi:hypothetical protein
MVKQSKIKFGVPPSQMKGAQWYLRKGDNIMTEEKLIAAFSGVKAISYFKVLYRSRGGVRNEIQYWKTLANGYMIFVDMCNMKMGIVQGIGMNRGIEGSTKAEFNKKFKLLVKLLSV